MASNSGWWSYIKQSASNVVNTISTKLQQVKDVVVNTISDIISFPKQPEIEEPNLPIIVQEPEDIEINKLSNKRIHDMMMEGDVEAFNQFFSNPKHKSLSLREIEKLFNTFKAEKNIEGVKGRYLLVLQTDKKDLRYLITEKSKQIFYKSLSNEIEQLRDLYKTKNGSDVFDEYVNNQYQVSIVFSPNKEYKASLQRVKNGKFFNFINTTDIDLSRYQIYTKEQILDDTINNNRQSCLIHALNTSMNSDLNLKNLYDDDVDIILHTKSRAIPKSSLHTICDILKIQIKLYEVDKNNEVQSYTYGKNNYLTIVKLSLYKEHYFLYEDIQVSKSYINNYKEIQELIKSKPNLKHIPNRYKFSEFLHNRTSFKINESVTTNNLVIVKAMMEQGLFIQDDDTLTEEYSRYYENNTISLKHINDETLISNEIPNPKAEKLSYIFIADTECDIITSPIHKPILFVVKSLDGKHTGIFKGENCVMEAFDFISNKTPYGFKSRVYFHNVKYDFHAILQDIKTITNILQSDGMLYTATILHNNGKFNRLIELYDSYKYIRCKVSEMPEAFNLDKDFYKNEAIVYSYHTIENITSDDLIDINTYKELLPVEKREIFLNEVKHRTGEQGGLVNGRLFSPSSYYIDYCIFDVEILRLSLIKFNEATMKRFNKSIFSYITISSFSFDLIRNDIFNVCQSRGNIRMFIDSAIYGGRVICKEKNLKLTTEIQDFDACSMYPSAIVRLCKEYGIPTTKPEVISNFDNIKNDSNQYYIVKVRITKINKKFILPIVCDKTDEGNNYLNEISEPITVVIDRITFEDYIKYQEIEYEFIEGITYSLTNSNRSLGNTILKLYNDRLTSKKEGNKVMSDLLKLVMNSIYGKSMQKCHTDKLVMKTTETLEEYIHSRSNTINSIEKINNNNYLINEYSYDDSYSFNIIAVMILSISKRMMNEVFYCAELNNVGIYYTDTDSMHIDNAGISKVAETYTKLYNKTLIGSDLEQFHCDFEFSKGHTDIKAVSTIIYDKKIYCDKLSGIDRYGNITYEYHWRMKGFSKSAIQHYCDINNIGIMELYERLIQKDRKPIEIVMNYDEYHPSFDINNKCVMTKAVSSFIRSI